MCGFQCNMASGIIKNFIYIYLEMALKNLILTMFSLNM